MLKKITTLLLLLTFTVQTFHKVFIVVAFYGNQDYIAKTRCENKYRPQLKCNGTCQLAKQLQQEQKKDQDNPERKLENKNEVFSSRSFYPTLVNKSSLIVSNFNQVSIGSPVDMAKDFFHPPAA